MSSARAILRFRNVAALALGLSLSIGAALSRAEQAPADTTSNPSATPPASGAKPSPVASPVAPLIPMPAGASGKPDSSGAKAAAPSPAAETHAPKAAAAMRRAQPVDIDSSEDFEEPPKRIPDVTGPVFLEVRSIPYPNGAIYVNRGITGSFLGGKHQNLGEAQSLFQWQGELGYCYSPSFSGG